MRMTGFRRMLWMEALPLVCVTLGWGMAYAADREPLEPYYWYDDAEETVEGAMLESPLYHDAGIASREGVLWTAWRPTRTADCGSPGSRTWRGSSMYWPDTSVPQKKVRFRRSTIPLTGTGTPTLRR